VRSNQPVFPRDGIEPWWIEEEHAIPELIMQLGSILFNLVILVASVAALFYKGCDMSQLPAFDCSGQCSPYRNNVSVQTEDALRILKENGVNTVRLRIWNNPTKENSYCNLDGVLKMAARAKAAGYLSSFNLSSKIQAINLSQLLGLGLA